MPGPDVRSEPRIQADTLIRGAVIVTMDDERRIITDASIAIAKDRIVAIGKRADLDKTVDATEVIDGRRFIITPGFVNGHIHATETLVKGYIPENLGFDEGVWRWSVPLYQLQTPEEQALAGQLAAVSMLRTGTTCFLEAGTVTHLDSVFERMDAIGIRGRIGQWVLDRAFSPDDDQTAMTDAALRILEDELVRYPGKDGQRLAAWPLLIGHNTNSDALWQGAKALADEHGAGISAHMSPVENDPDWYVANIGRRPIEHLAWLGALGPNVNLTHMVHIDQSEFDLLVETGTNVTHCPGPAMKGAFGLAGFGRFPEMDAAGVTVMLATDGADHADMMRSMTMVASVFKDARRDASIFPPHRALTMATLNGAKALGLADQIGSLAVGMKADFVLHDTDRPEWKPVTNYIAQLVWSADGRGVHSVWVDGKRVVDNYRCTTIDEERLFIEAQRASDSIIARSGLPAVYKWPVI
jgi:5-methylthioadenosine/S-adenosylhomocysteine deaminase